MPWTPATAQSGLKIWSYEQVTPATTWEINHGMNSTPVVEISINVDGTTKRAFPKSLTYIDDNTVEILWNTPQSGFATFTSN